MNAKNFPYAHQSINVDDMQAVNTALSGDVITRGAHVEAFESAIAEYCGAKYAVAFNSATTALAAACHAVDLDASDRMLTTPNTFVATTAAGMHKGATPIFVDIDRSTGNMDIELLEQNLKDYQHSRGRTLIMPVHFGGIPVDMERVDCMINDPDTLVIEDAAQALGSCYPDGQMVGCCAWSQMTVFSFHPAKIITTGEGGMVTTNDSELYHRLQSYRNNGIVRDPACFESPLSDHYEGYYEVAEMTGNYNFTDFQAALGLSQFKRINSFIDKRRQLVARYRELLQGLPHVKTFTSTMDSCVAFHLFVVQIDFAALKTTRERVMTFLKKKGIGTQVHYIPIYQHPFFKEINPDLAPYFPEMEAYYAQALTLPLYYDLTGDDVEFIVSTLKKALKA
jgi:UDP-4-amino-4,6-dideoxy-N-acetyl-beta-L-altrosamine transaminase